jgi:YhcN/YlaJ family sporulation lipoprotein
MTKKNNINKVATLLAIATIFATGCANRNNPGQPGAQGQQGNQAQSGAQASQAQNQPQGTNADNRVQVADQAAQKITQLNGVRQANVLVTGRNAYVAAVVNTNQGQMSRQLDDQISQQVRAADPNIQNVYVSTNPEFVQRVNRYVTDVAQGRPVTGFVEEFSQMVQRIFPTAR